MSDWARGVSMCFFLNRQQTRPPNFGIPVSAEQVVSVTEPDDVEAAQSHQAADVQSAQPLAAENANVRVTGSQRVNGTYSIQFEIYDNASNVIERESQACAGIYYTIKVTGNQPQIINTDVTDGEGKTLRVFSYDPNARAYLYIGHRQDVEADLPQSRSTDALIYDEALLNSEDADQTLALHDEEKLQRITTTRLWKPWTYSEDLRSFLITVEAHPRTRRHVEYFQDLERRGVGNTVGYGHYERELRGDGSRNPAFDHYMRLYPDARHPISEEDAIILLEADIVRRGGISSFNAAEGNNALRVPLHQCEFDALVDMTYNAGMAGVGINARRGRDNVAPYDWLTGETVKNLLHQGKYTEAGDTIVFRTNTEGGQRSAGVQRRRNAERGIFFGGSYQWRDYPIPE